MLFVKILRAISKVIFFTSLVSISSWCWADDLFIPANEYCHLLMSHPTLVRFANASKNANQSGVENSVLKKLNEVIERGSMVDDWVLGKMEAAYPFGSDLAKSRSKEDDSEYYGLSQDAGAAWHDYKDKVINICGKELVNSDVTFSEFVSQRTERAKEEYDRCKSSKVKKIADDGSVKFVEPPCDAEADGYFQLAEHDLLLPKVLALKNGDKVFQTGAEEIITKLEADISQAKVDKQKNEAIQLAQKKREDAAHVAQVANEKAENVASLQRISKMKASGDYSIAANCGELAQAMGGEKVVGHSDVLVNPDNKIYVMLEILDEFDGNHGYLKYGSQYSEISTTKNTIWKSKEKIKIKGMVGIVGRYVANGNVVLVNGTGQPVRTYEVICIQP